MVLRGIINITNLITYLLEMAKILNSSRDWIEQKNWSPCMSSFSTWQNKLLEICPWSSAFNFLMIKEIFIFQFTSTFWHSFCLSRCSSSSKSGLYHFWCSSLLLSLNRNLFWRDLICYADIFHRIVHNRRNFIIQKPVLN